MPPMIIAQSRKEITTAGQSLMACKRCREPGATRPGGVLVSSNGSPRLVSPVSEGLSKFSVDLWPRKNSILIPDVGGIELLYFQRLAREASKYCAADEAFGQAAKGARPLDPRL
jgi:hypothetical protein